MMLSFPFKGISANENTDLTKKDAVIIENAGESRVFAILISSFVIIKSLKRLRVKLTSSVI
ncbi:MAG: hypothetical protein IKK94_01325 [Clostridia bacterium]|nr:hypothetical protein [Clostridia bacterium]